MGSKDKKHSKDLKKRESKKRPKSSSSSDTESVSLQTPVVLSERLQCQEKDEITLPGPSKSYDDFDVPLRAKTIKDFSIKSSDFDKSKSDQSFSEKQNANIQKSRNKNEEDHVQRRRNRDTERSRNQNRERRNSSPEDESSRSRSVYRHENRYSSRNDNRRDRNEITGRRYWDNEQINRKRYRDCQSDEEHAIGERFYGGETKIYDNHDRKNSEKTENDPEKDQLSTVPPSQKRTVDLLTSKTGGAYIPPAKLRLMQAEIQDKSGAAFQRIAWEALKKSIHGSINKVNTSNIGLITRELLRENIVRGRGLLTRSIIQAQAASPTFTSVYAALTAVINSKFPNIGELLLKRLVNQFRRAFRLNNKPLCISSGTFIAHLVNHRVAHEILALELLTLLVDTPTDDSVEVAIAFLKECGMKLTEVSRKGIEAIFEMLRNILHEGQLDKRVQYMIEVIFQIRKDGFKDHEAVPEDLDLVEEDDQFTHLITLDETIDCQDILNVFKLDPEYVENEDKYKQLSTEILDTDGSSEGEDAGEDDGSSDEEYDQEEEGETKEGLIIDNTETNLTALRRTIYLTIHSSATHEECAHKLLKMKMKPGQEIELCHMFLDCCAEMRTYEKFFGLLAGRFCAINKIYIGPFEQIFKDSYDTIHRLDMNKLRNVSKFFAHLLFTDAISWNVLNCIKLNEEDTTSSSRIFIKILFQELSEYMGLSKLNSRVKDITLQEAFEGLFPRDDPKNTRFAINFFTSIGLGGLTDDLREHLKTRPKPVPPLPIIKPEPSSTSKSSLSSSSSSSSSSESSSASSASSSSDRNRKKKNKKKKTSTEQIQLRLKKKKKKKSSKKKKSLHKK